MLCYNDLPIIPNTMFEDVVRKFHVACGHMGKEKQIDAIKGY